MPRLGMIESESRWVRILYVLVMAAILGGYSYMLKVYWAPAHPGINQNAYLVAGRLLAQNGTPGIKVTDGYAYLGWMWNIVEPFNMDAGAWWFYPKYPMGTSALFAAMLRISHWMYGDWEAGRVWSFLVNPVCMVLALAAMFMLLRQYAGSFIAVLGTMILGCSQVVLSFAEQPLSHGPAMCSVTWGMYFLLRWWQTASVWRGVLAGLFLGYAVTTRYTEGLLLIPLGAVLVTMVDYDVRRTRWWSLSIWVALAVIGIVLRYNLEFKVDGWVGYTVGALAAATLASLPLLRRELADSSDDVTRIAPPPAEDGGQGRAVLEYATSNSAQAFWIVATFHVLRTLMAAVLVWGVVCLDSPKRTGQDDVGRMVETILFKTLLGGALVLLYLIPWQQPRRWLKVVCPALAWALPVGILIGFNWIAMNSLTGYDSTNESTAFTWRTFMDKWDDTVQQLHDYSMFLVPPLAVAGIFLMFRWSWRAALLVMLWLVPGLLLYIAYYFGKQRPGMWYLRFFMTLFPPMVIAAMWLLKSAVDGMRARWSDGETRGSVAVPLGLGVFTFCSCAVGLWISIPSLEREHAANTNLFYTCQQIVQQIPRTIINGKVAPPVVFAEGRANPNGPLCNFLQFAADFELYASDGFQARGRGFRESDPNTPNPLQAARQEWLSKWFSGKSESDIKRDQNQIMTRALDEERQVFAVLQPGVVSFFRNRFIAKEFEMRLVAQWREPAKVQIERSTGPLDPSGRGLPANPTRMAQTWQLYQIVRAKPPPAPAEPPPAEMAPTGEAMGPTTAPTTQPAKPS